MRGILNSPALSPCTWSWPSPGAGAKSKKEMDIMNEEVYHWEVVQASPEGRVELNTYIENKYNSH